MIITVGGIKGGSGKSTVAVHLAVINAQLGRRVLLVDTDEQGTSYDFSQYRIGRLGDAGFTCTKQHGPRIHLALEKFAEAFDLIVVDTGGRDSKAQRSALAVSTLVVLPFVPRVFDAWTMEPLAELLEELRLVNGELRALSFINRADRSGPLLRMTEDHLRDSQQFGIEFTGHRLHTRVAFGAAAAVGLAVQEMTPRDEKAALEMLSLAGYIMHAASEPPFHFTHPTLGDSHAHSNSPQAESPSDPDAQARGSQKTRP